MSVHSRYRAGLWHPYEKPMCGVLLNPYHPLARGLVGCWLFNEGGGSIVYDLSGHGNHGTLGGGTAGYCPAWMPGKIGLALNFDGSDDYIDCGNGAFLNGLSAFSISAWVKSDVTTVDAAIWCGQDSDTMVLRYDKQGYEGGGSNVILFYFQTTTGGVNRYESASNVQTTDWQHIVAIWNGSDLKMYIDGIEDSPTFKNPGTGVSTNADRCQFGRKGTTNYWDGFISTIMMWERVLDASEVWQLYTDPFCIFYHPLEAELLYAAAPPAGIVPQAMHHYRMLRT